MIDFIAKSEHTLNVAVQQLDNPRIAATCGHNGGAGA